MFFQKSIQCPKCGKNVPQNMRFCSFCGAALSTGVKACGACGAENKGDARFCKNCGRTLADGPETLVRKHRWSRDGLEFAVRIEADDLPGWLEKGIVVEPGTQAIMLIHGSATKVLPPGEYFLDTIGQTITDWVAGKIPEKAVILLVDTTPVTLEYRLGGIFTADPLKIGASLLLEVQTLDAHKVVVNLLKGRDRVTLEELRQHLYPELAQALGLWVGRHKAREMAEDPALKFDLENQTAAAMQTTLDQLGLTVTQVRAVQLNLETLDRARGIQVEAVLMNEEMTANLRKAAVELNRAEQETRLKAENTARLEAVRLEYEHRKAEAELAGRKRFAELQKEQNLVALAEETAKVEQEEQMAALYKRMRQALTGDKMDEIRSEAEFEAFLDGVDRQKLLREKERADLLQTWKDEAADKQKARANLLAKMEVEQNHQLRLAEIKSKRELDTLQQDAEIEISRQRRDFELETTRRQQEEALALEEQREVIRQKRAKAQLEETQAKNRAEVADARDKAQAGAEMLARMNEIARLDEAERLRTKREDDLARAKAQAEQEAQRFEQEIRRMEAMKTLTPEALLTMTGPEQAQALVALRETEALRGMSAEQILAMAARKSPEIGVALAQAKNQAGVSERDLRAEMDAQRAADLERERQASDRRAQDLKDAMGMMADVAKTLGKGGQASPPVIVVPGTGVVQPAGVEAGSAPQEATKRCPKCGRLVAVEARFCEHCQNAFPDQA